jgi:acetyl esterase/lipase
MMKRQVLIILLMLCAVCSVQAKEKPPAADRVVEYKKIGDVSRSLHIFNPEGHKPSDRSPAIVFFHGGGWNGGGYMQFSWQCDYLASRGMVAIAAEYRTMKRFGTTPKECVMDAKSAMRWIRAHADELGIDPNRLAAGGGSAGGHLAAATALLEGFNEAGEDTSVSCVPNALVLFNPVADNGPSGWGHDRVKEYWMEFSPLHNIHKDAPPTVILTGSADTAFKIASAKAYEAKMKEMGRRCDLYIYEGQPHAFFNRERSLEMHYQTMLDADRFLVSLGYLSGKAPTLNQLLGSSDAHQERGERGAAAYRRAGGLHV